MNIRNYQKELDRLIGQIQKENKVPSLFLHSCCAPCSSYVLEYLSKYFDITVFYYNPNIYPEEEYRKRVQEITRLVNSMEIDALKLYTSLSVSLVKRPPQSCAIVFIPRFFLNFSTFVH